MDRAINKESEKKSREVQAMFNSIAKRYDLGNSILSFGTHFIWRNQLLSMLPKANNNKVLDICTGTGDLLPLLAKRFSENNPKNVIGLDFSENMLSICREKHSEFKVIQGDALNLPFEDNSFDIASVSFGVRNYADLNQGLKEIYRILKPQGQVLILEFGQPKLPLFSQAYELYSRYIMPIIGGLVTGNRSAYEYLPETAKKFPCGEDFKKELESVGFKETKFKSLTFGVAFSYCSKK